MGFVMSQQSWPVREPDQAIPVVAHIVTSTHSFDYTADGVLSIQRNELRDISKDPELMRATEGQPNFNVLNEEGVDALFDMLVRVRQARKQVAS